MALPVKFGDRYLVRRQLAEGGAGNVYLATERDTQVRVVVKHLRKEALGDVNADQWSARFEREIKILLGLNHPNIVRYLDHGMAEGRPYLVTEYIHGDPFDHGI